MSSWLLLDGDPAPGDPNSAAALARQLAQAGEQFDEGRGRLTRMMAANSLPSWMGPAAAAFAAGLEPLRDDLRQAAESFDVAATALSTYVRVLDALQTRARNLLAQAVRAQERIDAANLSLSRASASVEQTIAAQGLDPVAAMIHRRQTLAPYEQAVRDAEAWLRSVRSQAQDLRREHEAAARTAADGFGHATKVGIHENWRDLLVSAATWINDSIDAIKPYTTLIAVAVLAVFVVAFTGGAGIPALALAVTKFGLLGKAALVSKFVSGVSAADVGARIARRGLGDETMTDSNTELAVDGALVAVSLFGVPKVAEAAARKGQLAIDTVQTTGYHGSTYHAVSAAHQSMNRAMALHVSVDSVSLFEDVPLAVRRLAGGTRPQSVYEPPVSPLPPPTTPPAIGGTPPIVGQTAADPPLRASVEVPPLQASLDALAWRAGDGPVAGLRRLAPVVRTTSYRFPIDVRN